MLKNKDLKMIKRKGQIVPKYLVKSVEKKAQHLVKFGCDVEINGRVLTAINGGVCIVIPEAKYCNMKKNKRTVKGFNFDVISLIGFDTFIHVTGQINLSVKNISFQQAIPGITDHYPKY